MKEPHPPAPSPKRRGGERRNALVFLPLSVSGRGPGGGVLSQPLTPFLSREERGRGEGAVGWREPNSPLPASVREALSPALRGRTLVLLGHHCPYYLHDLTAEERELYAQSFGVTARLFARGGVRAAAVGQHLAAQYYSDHIHLTAAGGRLMAEEVAPLVRELARELGYLPSRSAEVFSRGAKP